MIINYSTEYFNKLSLKSDRVQTRTETEFKEFELRLKYGWFNLKSYSLFQDLSPRSIITDFWRI